MDTKALRQKILDLAIRGKLVPQDPNDEPASVLLEKIREQKQQMFKEGKLKKKDIKNDSIIFKGEDNLHYEKFADGSVKCIEDEIPFEVPEGWAWARIGTVCSKVTDGTHHSPDNYPIGEYKYITAKNIKLNGIILEDITYITAEVHKEIFSRCNPEFGDILYIKDGATSGIATINTMHEEFSMLSSVALLKPAYGIDNWYMCYAMQSPYFYTTTRGDMKGVGITRITLNMLVSRLIPVPPLQEQKQISVKCRELISLFSNIENDKEFIQQILSETKSKILDLAIRGKLVPQDPNDEPASILLERIRAEKEELIKQGKIKRDKKESVIFKGEDNSYYERVGDIISNIDDEIPFKLPQNWEWSRLQTICYPITDGTHKTPTYSDSGYIFLSAKNITTGKIDWNDVMYIPKSLHDELYSRVSPKMNDILLAKNGTTGVAAIVDRECEFDIYVTLALLRVVNHNIFSQYLLKIIASTTIQDYFKSSLKGIGVPNLHLEHIRTTLIPIAPINEQKKIAEKISQYYSLLDYIDQNVE